MIRLSGLGVELPGFTLGSIDLEIASGEYFVLLGPTGAGKSVMLGAIAGVNRPSGGSIIINGLDVDNVPIHKRGVSMVFQDRCLFEHMRVYDNIAYPLKIAGLSRREISGRVHVIAEEVGISDQLPKYPDKLSGGQQQRVALARALINRPKCLLLDEPLSAIDVIARVEMRNLLRILQERYKLTVLHVTHDFEDALMLADRMAVMNQGQLVETGSCRKLFNRPDTAFVAVFLGSGNVLSGKIVSNNGECVFVTEHNRFTLGPQAVDGHAYMMIRPEHIVLSREPLKSSARNCIGGEIKNIVWPSAGTASVEVDAGDIMRVTVLSRTATNMGIKNGDKVYMTFKSSAAHIINSKLSG